VHGNTADWQRSDVDAAPVTGQYSPAKSIGEGIGQHNSWGYGGRQKMPKTFDAARFAGLDPTKYGNRMANSLDMNKALLPSMGNYTAMGDIYGVSGIGKRAGLDERGRDQGPKGAMIGTPGGLFDYWNMIS